MPDCSLDLKITVYSYYQNFTSHAGVCSTLYTCEIDVDRLPGVSGNLPVVYMRLAFNMAAMKKVCCAHMKIIAEFRRRT